MKVVMFISNYYSKKFWPVSPFAAKILRKYFLMKNNAKTFPWIHLQTTKISSHRIRSKTGIWLEIILNVSQCFIIVSRVTLIILTFPIAPFLFI